MTETTQIEVPVLVLGESHCRAISRSIEETPNDNIVAIDVRQDADSSKINVDLYSHYRPKFLVLAFGGVEHNIVGLIGSDPQFDFVWPPHDTTGPGRTPVPASAIEEMIELRLQSSVRRALRARESFDCPVYALAPPPPFLAVDSETNLPKAFESMRGSAISPADVRQKLYALQCSVMRRAYDEHGISLLNAPRKTCDTDGFLLRRMWNHDPTHGNRHYGQQVIQHVLYKLRVNAAGQTGKNSNG